MKNWKFSLLFLFCFVLYWCFCAISEQSCNGSLLKDKFHCFEKPHKKVVYTCICGHYDSLISHSYVCDDWDYVCFTDNQELLKNGHHQWTIRPLAYADLDNTRNNRWHKIFPHKILGEYKVSLYLDGNINITNSELFDYINNELIGKKSKTLVINSHPERNCIYQEAQVCKEWNLDSASVIDSQMLIFRQLNYPEFNGLTENFMIYRRHHNAQVKEVMADWWWWVSNYSKRDQLSFNFVIWNRNFKIYLFEDRFSRTGNCLDFILHQKEREVVMCQHHI